MSFFDGSFFPLDDAHRILLDERPRSQGRTSYFQNLLMKRSLADKSGLSRFLWIRRKKTEIEELLASGFGSNLLRPPALEYYGKFYKKRNLVFRVDNGKILLANEKTGTTTHVGYLRDLNNVKGSELSDVDVICFDEIIATNRNDYKGGGKGINEPKLLNAMIQTVMRTRSRGWLIMLGNSDFAVTNPYSEYFHVPYGVKKWKDGKGFFYRSGNITGEIDSFANYFASYDKKTYDASVLGGSLLDVPDYQIENKPATATNICAVKVGETVLTLWIDLDTGLLYVHDNYKIDRTRPVYTAFNDDMSVDSTLLYMSAFPQLKTLKNKYITNQIRYNNQRTASRYATVIELLRA